MPTLFSDADVGLGTAPAPRGSTMSDADVGITSQPVSETGVRGQISLPGIGAPSLIGMAKGLFSAGKSAVTLPGDVLAGKVDPLSDEGIQRALEAATMIALPSAGRTMAMTAGKAPTVAELQAAAKPIYEELTQAGNVVTNIAGKDIAKGIEDVLHPQALRPASAPRTYNELKGLNEAKDLNDVAIVRDNLRDVANGIAENRLIRVTGNDTRAARQAMGQLDAKMEELSPGWTPKMAEADANWAASKRIEKVQEQAGKGERGRLGSFDANAMRAKGYTPEELAAIKKAHQGGMTGTVLNAIGAGLSPFHGGISGGISAAMHLPSAFASGGSTLLGIPIGIAADAIAGRLRQRALNQAIDKIAYRSSLGAQNMPSMRQMSTLPPISPALGLLSLLPPRDPQLR